MSPPSDWRPRRISSRSSVTPASASNPRASDASNISVLLGWLDTGEAVAAAMVEGPLRAGARLRARRAWARRWALLRRVGTPRLERVRPTADRVGVDCAVAPPASAARGAACEDPAGAGADACGTDSGAGLSPPAEELADGGAGSGAGGLSAAHAGADRRPSKHSASKTGSPSRTGFDDLISSASPIDVFDLTPVRAPADGH